MTKNTRAAAVIGACLLTATIISLHGSGSSATPLPKVAPGKPILAPVASSPGLPSCVEEDGSGGPRPCHWNGHIDGNGVGLSYVVHTDGTVTYDPGQHDPAGTNAPMWMWVADEDTHAGSEIHQAYEVGTQRDWVWMRVDHELGDALAEGGAPHADTRDWSRCVFSPVVVVCPDGWVENL